MAGGRSTARQFRLFSGDGDVSPVRPFVLDASTRETSSWVNRYIIRLKVSDTAIAIAAVFAAQWLRFGTDASAASAGSVVVPMIVVSVLLIVGLLVAMSVYGTYDRRVLGTGPQEYSRVISACLLVFGVFAILVLAVQLDISRAFFALAFPIGTLGLIGSRWMWRKRLTRQWADGHHLERVLVVGESESSRRIVERLLAAPHFGYQVIGVCLPPDDGSSEPLVVGDQTIPVFGDFADVTHAVSVSGATTVAITSAEALGHDLMHQLSWDLDALDVEMLVAPGVADTAGPRLMVRPVSGLPLLHIDKPRYEGATQFRKAALDRVGAATLLLISSPLLLLIALAVKLDSHGPVFYRAERVGMNNTTFRMWKFRSMVVDADALRADLIELNEGAGGVLFKMRDDPRVTRVGKFIRRYSLDELPQLINVFTGSMSLVGPRPPLPDEVARYDGHVARRMLVKPGMTGLWQVSGRSDLSWEESVRLDLSYVENWSIMQDIVILWRTVQAVTDKSGAY